ncbi:MAG: hypothetical protein IKR27_09530 [Lachnospiraceae bacterium]|nr:hypothetical protein [Lachnospiraceae bacterium]
MIKFKSAFKKLAATAMAALTLAVSLPKDFEAQAAEADYSGTFDAYIYFMGSSEGSDDYDYLYNAPGDPNNQGNITVTEAKGVKVGDTFTVSMEFDKPVSEICSLEPVLVASGIMQLEPKVKLKIDGEEVKVSKNGNKPWWYDDKARTIIKLYGGYEQFEETKQYFKDLENIPTGFKKIEYEITINAATESDQSFDPAGKYNGYFCFQTPKYSFRNDWNDTYGLNYTDDRNMDYFHQVTGWEEGDTQTPITMPGTFTDVEIAGNGTYEVKVSGLEFSDSEFAEQDYFNLIFLSTDIPKNGGAEITDIKLNVDGNDIEGIAPEMNDEILEYQQYSIQNKWSGEPKVQKIPYFVVPCKEMTITFTVSGFNYDKAGSEESSSAADPAESSSAESSSAESAPAESSSAAPAESSSSAADSSTKSDSSSSAAASSSSSAADSSSSSSSGGLGTPAIIGILAGAIVIVGGIIFAVTKKKK